MTDQIWTLEFDGRAGDTTDVRVQRAIREAGGDITGAGTFLMSDPTRRDIEFVISSAEAPALITRLRLMGIEPRAKVQ